MYSLTDLSLTRTSDGATLPNSVNICMNFWWAGFALFSAAAFLSFAGDGIVCVCSCDCPEEPGGCRERLLSCHYCCYYYCYASIYHFCHLSFLRATCELRTCYNTYMGYGAFIFRCDGGAFMTVILLPGYSSYCRSCFSQFFNFSRRALKEVIC